MSTELKQSFRDVALEIDFEKVLRHAKEIEKNAYAPNFKLEEEKYLDFEVEELKIPSYQELIEKINKIKDNKEGKQEKEKKTLVQTGEPIILQKNEIKNLQTKPLEYEEVEKDRITEPAKIETTQIQENQKKRLEEILKRLRRVEEKKQIEQTIPKELEKEEANLNTNIAQNKNKEEVETVTEITNKSKDFEQKDLNNKAPLDIFKKLEQKIIFASEQIPKQTVQENLKEEKLIQPSQPKQFKKKAKKPSKKEIEEVEKVKEIDKIAEEEKTPAIKPKKRLEKKEKIKIELEGDKNKEENEKNLRKTEGQKNIENEKNKTLSLEKEKEDIQNFEIEDYKESQMKKEPILINKKLAKKLGIEKTTEKIENKKIITTVEEIYPELEEKEGEEDEEKLNNYTTKEKLKLSEEAEELLTGKSEKTETEKDSPPEVYVAYAKENIPWLYDIYKIGAISFDEFKQKVKEKMNKINISQEDKNDGEEGGEKNKKDSEIKIKKFKK